MERFMGGVLRHRKLMMMIFTVAALVCIWLTLKVDINYDMSKYVPDDAPSTKAIKVMNEEFASAIPNGRVAIRMSRFGKRLPIKSSSHRSRTWRSALA